VARELTHLRWQLDPVEFFTDAVGSEPDRWQADLLRSESKNIILNASRQSGKSQTTAILALHHALYTPGALALVLAPSLRQSQELFGKVLGALRDLGSGDLIKPAAQRRLSLELENGSRILTLPGSEKTIRGFSSVSLLLLDEASRVPDELYFAVRPMLAVSGGRLIMLSTPWGRRGVFYEVWEHGEGWEKYRVTAHQVDRISEEFLEEERMALPPWVFRSEYECSFEDTEDTVFTTEMIERAISPDVKPLFPKVG
jgi:Terminase large subunit, T4likevirus-type, N-terminal